MSDRALELLDLYERERVDDQLRFFRERSQLFGRAAGQAAAVAAVLLGLTSAVSALAGVSTGHTQLWAALAAILPTLTTALAAFNALYAFDRQTKLYDDAARSLLAARRARPDIASLDDEQERVAAVRDYVTSVESVLRTEQGQWGQLTSSIDIPEALRQ